jgi:hypothetical protein
MKILMLCVALMVTPAWAEDWTVDGKDYHNVKVTDISDDSVAVTYDGGIGHFALADLPPELKKRFNYDPEKANAAIARKEQILAEQEKAAQDENRQMAEQAAVLASRKPLTIQVLQVLTEGVLAEKMTPRYHVIADSMANVGGGGRSTGYTTQEDSGVSVFVEMNSTGITEGATLNIVAVPSGTYAFTDTDNVNRVVEKWKKIEPVESN